MNSVKDIEKMVLHLVSSENYKPVKPRTIAKKLDLLDQERDVKKALKRLIKQGAVAWGPKHLVMKAAGKAGGKGSSGSGNEVTGLFRRAAAGYGFVKPNNSTATDRSDDVYIPKQKTLDASDGDIVKIRVSRRRQGNETRVSGRVIDVVERRTNRFVGTYRENSGFGFVIVDGGVFESGVMVGDAGAKSCRVGDVVVIEMANFPSPHQPGEGVIVEVLGDRGKPGVDTITVIREFDLPEEFPEAVLQAARDQAEDFDEEIGDRTDFTGETVITIDPKTARDFDDAISLKKIENDHWLLGVHIADVSHFVPRKSALDDEAYARATSIYLPDRVIPMLPELISNNLASLQPDRIRYCMTAMIEFNPQGIPIGTELYRGAIKSKHRFNYEEIDDYLENDKPWKQKLPQDVFRLVRDMHTLAMMLRKRRLSRGAIELTLPDVKLELDEDGKVAGAYSEEHTESHQIIEEFMLAANEAVARDMFDRDLHFIRRIHEAPSPAKLKELTKFMRQIGIQCESLESRFEIKRIAEAAGDRPEAKAIHFSILRSMQKAVYSPKEVGHYALASDAYCHFTSPIRRYPDLVIHRMIGDIIDGKKPDSNFGRIAALGNHCSHLEQRAESAERELIKMKLLNFFSDKIGEQMQAVITGVEPFGLFAQGVKIPAEGLIPIANLPDDHYHFDRPGRTLSGYHSDNDFRLGDLIEVRVSHVDRNRRQLEFQLVEGGTSGRRPKQDSGRPRSKDGKPRDDGFDFGKNKGKRKKDKNKGKGKGAKAKKGKGKGKDGKGKSGKSKSGSANKARASSKGKSTKSKGSKAKRDNAARKQKK